MKDPYYPDDVRQYDHDPRSPFYDDSAEVAQAEWIQGRTEENMQEPDLVFEATGELTDDEQVELARLVSSAEKTDYEAIGRLIYSRIEKHCEELAEKEAEEMLDDH